MMMALIRGLRRDQSGVSAVEFALILPMLLTLLLGSVTLFDLFRTAQSAEKSTFTVGDMLSRDSVITDTRLKDLVSFIEHTVTYEGASRLRVTSVSNVGGVLKIDWSKTAGNASLAIDAVAMSALPRIAVGDSVIFTETFIPHRAFVAVGGLDRIVYRNRAVHRPRFVSKIVFQ